jgi:hypothetical protein
MVHRIEHGQGRKEDLDLLNSIADNIQGRTICALGDAAAMPVRGLSSTSGTNSNITSSTSIASCRRMKRTGMPSKANRALKLRTDHHG